MPELPEVEVVRRGLDRWVTRRSIESVEVRHPRAVRRHSGSLASSLEGRQFHCASRRGKYLWLPLHDDGVPAGEALVIHLGMSGQCLVQPSTAEYERHMHVRIAFDDRDREMRFVDQRTFGGVYVDELTDDGGGGAVPQSVRHIARDPLDPDFDMPRVIAAIRAKGSAVKRVLLDQSVVSGVGNIYADEALWRVGLHGRRTSSSLSHGRVEALLAAAAEVMEEALAQGGTSFDSLYVNVNGESGYFDRSLAAYGQEGRGCPRCGTPIRREAFMNRSSFSCPRCQVAPRGR